MSENFRSEQSVEIFIKTKWWVGLIIATIMPLCLVGATFTDPTFNSFKGNELIIISVAIFSVIALTISLLCRKIIKRFSVDSSTRSLVYELFWSGLRVFKKTYPFETINKFDIILKNLKEGKYSPIHRVEVLTLVFQSGKMKFFTGIHDWDNVKTWANQLNNLLQDQGGFPAERFAEPLVAHGVCLNKKTLKILYAIIISGFVVIFLLLAYVIIAL